MLTEAGVRVEAQGMLTLGCKIRRQDADKASRVPLKILSAKHSGEFLCS